MAKDPEQLAHKEWLGYVQPVGLVVSIPALLAAQAHINRNIIPDHQRFLDCLPRDAHDELIPELRDFAGFTQQVLGWRGGDLEIVPPGDARYATIEVPLPEYGETLRPTHVVRELEPKDPQHPWMMLIQLLPTGTALEDAPESKDRTWHASPQARVERLLREARVPIGLLCNATQLRLVYAPRGETSGFATFSVSEMAQVAGRSIFAALHMLLCEERLFSLGEKQRLPAILADSRKYQNVVSTQLAEQVLAALYELVRGFQAADDQAKGELLGEVLAENPNHVYQGLLTVLMRLVFVLYAEDRGLLSSDPIFANFYSITGLFERLRADDGRYTDTMNQRYGAWAQFLTLFRLIYEGGSHGEFKIPPRHGYLFDPDRYNFLEGRPWKTARAHHDGDIHVPRISDGVIFRVLNNLLILDGERLSYRRLDVEQIGSVYETMMGFDLEVAEGRSIALKPKKPHGAPTTINLEALLAAKGADRAKWFKEKADQDVTGQALDTLKKATTIDELLAALEKKIAKLVTPNVVSKGAIVLQPSDERRRSGSHYTPRSLTEPIVRTTLKPILEQLGPQPEPDQILALNVCDPAMGSGAFLVEACRQLGDELVKAWHVHKCMPKLPPDEDEFLHARRLVAQRCLYGVDKNPMAVDLSKLSLWLATLAKDHPFTFLDHSLRAGDSLVGLSRDQISGFHWSDAAIGKRNRDDEPRLIRDPIADRIRRATEYRQKILAARDDNPYDDLQQKLALADEALSLARLAGDLVISAYFSADKDRARIDRLNDLGRRLVQYVEKADLLLRRPLTDAVIALNHGPQAIRPFHWQIEFPEVFGREQSGFDAMVGNPPFLGGLKASTTLGKTYIKWLTEVTPQTHGRSDVVAYFFRNSFSLLRQEGALGLISTNSIRESDTRESGLTWIVTHGGIIYSAKRRLPWPGQAAVVVSVVHISKSAHCKSLSMLDDSPVQRISAYLFHIGPDQSPSQLHSTADRIFSGVDPNGEGFVLGSEEAQQFLTYEPSCRQHIVPYLGYEEMAESPQASFSRYIFNFENCEEEDVQKYPSVYQHLYDTVRLQRQHSSEARLRQRWWLYSRGARDYYDKIRGRDRVLACGRGGPFICFALQDVATVFSSSLCLVLFDSNQVFCVLQSRVHEVWARFFSSSFKDDPRNIPDDCFKTFAFPEHMELETGLEGSGKEYYRYRAELMIRNNEGLTKTYNRFHDPDERSTDILELRRLHAEMDRTVLEAYGWHDLAKTATCEFLLDYEDDEDDDDATSSRRQKKRPWRYRWPDDFHDEVLARLLELNKQRAEQERLTGIAAGAKQTGTKKGVGTRSKTSKT
jgi:hypothetical protein